MLKLSPSASIFFLLATMLVGACATVTSNVVPTADIKKYETYDWYTQAGDNKPESVSDQEIRLALASNMAKVGFRKVAAGEKPDFLVAHHVKERLQMSSTGGYGWGYGYGAGYGPWGDVYTYTQGTLIIDFIDPENNKAFWRGTASGALQNPDNVSGRAIDKAVAELMKKYPSPEARGGNQGEG